MVHAKVARWRNSWILFPHNYHVKYDYCIVTWCSGVACNWCASLDIAFSLALTLKWKGSVSLKGPLSSTGFAAEHSSAMDLRVIVQCVWWFQHKLQGWEGRKEGRMPRYRHGRTRKLWGFWDRLVRLKCRWFVFLRQNMHLYMPAYYCKPGLIDWARC